MAMRRIRLVHREFGKETVKKFSVPIIFMVFLSSTACSQNPKPSQGETRKPAVAGAFYPADAADLRQEIKQFLEQAKEDKVEGDIVGLVAPHAGYVYSGGVAAFAYKQLSGRMYETVVVISPSHREYFAKCAVYSGDAYETPLGVIPVNKDLAKEIASKNNLVVSSMQGHSSTPGSGGEHALEVQLPFLQMTLGNFKLVPIVMGDQRPEYCEALAGVLADALKGKNVLIVASSDLSHYHPYDDAVNRDNKVVNAFSKFDYLGLSQNCGTGVWEACGGGPIAVMMMVAEKLGANKSLILKYANSGDVPEGVKNQVVGYMAGIVYKTKQGSKADANPSQGERSLNASEREQLLHIAKVAIERSVKSERMPEFTVDSDMLRRESGAFVTIKKHGELRGCIGHIIASEPLYEVVRDVAVSAALQDPRFMPVSTEELKDLELEISVLTPLRKISDINEIEVGKHGILMRRGAYQGLLLPQVATEYNWDRTKFLEQTCLKAGLYTSAYKEKGTEIYIFSAEVFGER
jgi:AmmeMemoRadiSam system protein B/AmmeMemoRadiSam system protein A